MEIIFKRLRKWKESRPCGSLLNQHKWGEVKSYRTEYFKGTDRYINEFPISEKRVKYKYKKVCKKCSKVAEWELDVQWIY